MSGCFVCAIKEFGRFFHIKEFLPPVLVGVYQIFALDRFMIYNRVYFILRVSV